ncbi:ABC transporter permease, partial [Escherichia coli]|nr:ABC transporter permease [Escherichia coli]
MNTSENIRMALSSIFAHKMRSILTMLGIIIGISAIITIISMGDGTNAKFKKELERLNQGLDMALYMARLNNFHEDFHVETISLKDTVTKNINGLKELF